MRKTVKLGLILGILAMSSAVQAKHHSGAKLDKIVYPVAAEAWVSTDSAKVSVYINATLEKAGLAKAREQIMANLKRIANAEWRLVQFNRNQDRSGLETLAVTAQARVPESSLTNLHAQAKQISRPGTTYRIGNIDFTPSLKEVENARSALRESLYRQVNTEVERLNKVFPEQDYSVHKINYVGAMENQMRTKQVGRANAEVMAMQAMPLTVSNKIQLRARVVIAANRAFGKPQ